MYSDVGYRFRTNIFLVWDTIAPYHYFKEMFFWDFKFYNQDTYKSTEDITLIAEIYFRLEIDSILHSRKTETFFSWLEAMGGIPEILKMFAQMVIGTYLGFHSTMMNIKTFYKVEA